MAIVPDTKENEIKCLCPTCPTYKSSQCPKEKSENLFCARGKSKCELTDKGCLCGQCPLWMKYNLSKGYFCLNGKAE